MPDWVKTNGRYSVIYSYEIYIINKILHSNKNEHITNAHICELKMSYAGEISQL